MISKAVCPPFQRWLAFAAIDTVRTKVGEGPGRPHETTAPAIPYLAMAPCGAAST
jgi:hypothetical protein